jgi:hypothetical protein
VLVEQSLAESARKFATCVRKYLMLYLRLCELTNDWEALEKALHFLRTDKKVGIIRFERRERNKRVTRQDLDGIIPGKCIEKALHFLRMDKKVGKDVFDGRRGRRYWNNELRNSK